MLMSRSVRPTGHSGNCGGCAAAATHCDHDEPDADQHEHGGRPERSINARAGSRNARSRAHCEARRGRERAAGCNHGVGADNRAGGDGDGCDTRRVDGRGSHDGGSAAWGRDGEGDDAANTLAEPIGGDDDGRAGHVGTSVGGDSGGLGRVRLSTCGRGTCGRGAQKKGRNGGNQQHQYAFQVRHSLWLTSTDGSIQDMVVRGASTCNG